MRTIAQSLRGINLVPRNFPPSQVKPVAPCTQPDMAARCKQAFKDTRDLNDRIDQTNSSFYSDWEAQSDFEAIWLNYWNQALKCTNYDYQNPECQINNPDKDYSISAALHRRRASEKSSGTAPPYHFRHDIWSDRWGDGLGQTDRRIAMNQEKPCCGGCKGMGCSGNLGAVSLPTGSNGWTLAFAALILYGIIEKHWILALAGGGLLAGQYAEQKIQSAITGA